MAHVSQLFCHDLPSIPCPDIGKILITGASGYIGGRLVPEFAARGYQVVVMVRSKSEVLDPRWKNVEVRVADALDFNSVIKALTGIHTIYYLIHSLLMGKGEFISADIKAANNFRLASEKNDVKRIIYLGALGDVNTKLSHHLQSRQEVAHSLESSRYQTTILRAPMIVGSGSVSYEIIKDLAGRLPIIIMPQWRKTKCQPISIRDVIKYLVGAFETPEMNGKTFDIGGPQVLTYEEMVRVMSILLNKNSYICPLPIKNISVFSYIASFITKVPAPLVSSLFEGLKNDLICSNDSIKKYLSFPLLNYETSIQRALARGTNDSIDTSWSNAYPQNHEMELKLSELKKFPKYAVSYSLLTRKTPELIYDSFCRIGGKNGWFNTNFLWQVRGLIDRILMGVGSSRGRRNYSELKVNDVIDFWRVEDIIEKRKLLLRAEMKIPGKAWLEFEIEPLGTENKFKISAYYDTNNLFGKLYWYTFLPFHSIIFNDLIKQIEKRS